MFRFYVGDGGRRRGGLRGWVLRLLGHGPLNGAEIMEQMDQMTQGLWRPSPGSIYPLLGQMLADGVVEKRPDGRYLLSEAARQGSDLWLSLGWRKGSPHRASDAVEEIDSFTHFLEDQYRVDPSDIVPHMNRLRSLSERLRRLTEPAPPKVKPSASRSGAPFGTGSVQGD